MSKRILVAVDLSDASLDVLREGQAQSISRGATLAVVHVASNLTDIQPFLPQNYAINMTSALELEQIARDAFEKRVSEVAGSIKLEAFFERGSAYAEIVRRAEAWCADLVMVGSQRHTGLRRMMLGSVAERVARYAHCAVLVSRPRREGGVVLAATDLSDPSLPAVAAAVEEAQLRRVPLVVAHAVDNWFVTYGSNAGAFFGASLALPSLEAQTQLRASLIGLLRQAMDRFGGGGQALVLDGDPVAAIVGAAEAQRADLLVVGTHGRTGLSRVVLGSVAEKLVRLADCSVLVVRQAS